MLTSLGMLRQDFRGSNLEVAALVLQAKALLSVGSHSGRRLDELARFMLGGFAYEPAAVHCQLVLTLMLLISKQNGVADPESAIMMWLHPDVEDMYLDPLLSVAEWIVAMSMMPSLQEWLKEPGNDWRNIALFTPPSQQLNKLCWGTVPTSKYVLGTVKRGAELAGIVPSPAPRTAKPVPIFGPGIDRLSACDASTALPTPEALPASGSKKRNRSVSTRGRGGGNRARGRGRGGQRNFDVSSIEEVSRGIKPADPALQSSAIVPAGHILARQQRGRQPAADEACAAVTERAQLPPGVPNSVSKLTFGGHSLRMAFLDLCLRRNVTREKAEYLNGWFGEAAKRYEKISTEIRRDAALGMTNHALTEKHIYKSWPSYPKFPSMTMQYDLRDLSPGLFCYLVEYCKRIVQAAHPAFSDVTDLHSYLVLMRDAYKELPAPRVEALPTTSVTLAVVSVHEAALLQHVLTKVKGLTTPSELPTCLATTTAYAVWERVDVLPESVAYSVASQASAACRIVDSHAVGMAAKTALLFLQTCPRGTTLDETTSRAAVTAANLMLSTLRKEAPCPPTAAVAAASASLMTPARQSDVSSSGADVLGTLNSGESSSPIDSAAATASTTGALCKPVESKGAKRPFTDLPKGRTGFEDVYSQWYDGIDGQPPLKEYNASILDRAWVKSAPLNSMVSQRRLVVAEMDRIKTEESGYLTATNTPADIMRERFGRFTDAVRALGAQNQAARKKPLGRPKRSPIVTDTNAMVDSDHVGDAAPSGPSV